jgi:hypothetical protein
VIAVVHLVWGPLGAEPVRRFVDSYRHHRAGAGHDLIVVFNGVGQAAIPQFEAEFQALEHRSITLSAPVLDLGAYLQVAAMLEHDRACFLNSYAEILAEDWLAHLTRAGERAQVGLVGVAGSWETHAHRPTFAEGGLEHVLYQSSQLPRRLRQYPRFPNPAVRTSAFLIERELFLNLDLESPSSKEAAYRIEGGRNSITRQVMQRGLKAVIVGRNGVAYEPEEWPRSATFRSGGQANLLIADRRSREWESADSETQRYLSRLAWGRRSETRGPLAPLTRSAS